jgi:hypothetical protein
MPNISELSFERFLISMGVGKCVLNNEYMINIALKG